VDTDVVIGGEHPSLGEKPIRVSLLALVMCLLIGPCASLAAKISATDSTAGAVEHRDNST
jgi:hypothetical protein